MKEMKVINKKKLMFILPLLAVALTFAFATPAYAQDGTPPTAEQVSDITLGLNMLWMLIGGFLVFFMQAGFALVEAGFTRNKNVTHTMMMNMMVFCIGAIGYWLTGFAFQFGGVNAAYPEVATVGAIAGEWAHSPVTLGDWTGQLASPLLRFGQFGFLGGSGFFLAGLGTNAGILSFFLFQMVFMDTAATIPTGSMAERLKFSGFVAMSLWVSMFIYPMVAGWIWGGGWLQNLGRIAGLGNGAVDFAGSGPVHMIGGVVGLAGAIVLGPRIGKFNKDGSANTIPGHNITIGVLGTIILFFGWFGFNPGSSLGFLGGFRNLAVIAAINTLLAGAAGGCAAMTYMWLFGPSKKPDAGMSVNGVLAGLVAITAPCAFVDIWAAVLIGTIAGVLVILASSTLEKLKIDDPVGAVPVHMVNGAWGVLAVGIFANGNPDTAAWNGMESAVTGLIYGGSTQILAQLAEVVSIFVVVFGLSYLFFKAMYSLKLMRVSREDELQGLDMPEMGSLAYPADWEAPADAI